MATITSWEMRLVLDRNQNGLDGRPSYDVGSEIPAGLYWDPASREVVAVTQRRRSDGRLVSIHERLDASLDDIVRELAMGGGGHSGRPTPYENAHPAGRGGH